MSFLQDLRHRYHRSQRLYIVLDNHSIHKTVKVREFAAENNIELVFTPTYSSWLNHIECHFPPLRSFVLSCSNYGNHDELADAIQKYLRWRNKNAKFSELLRLQKRVKVADGALGASPQGILTYPSSTKSRPHFYYRYNNSHQFEGCGILTFP